MGNEKIRAGHFNLFRLLDFVAGEGKLPPKGTKGKEQEYTKKVDEILGCAKVPRDGGWYMWGRFNDAAWWEPLYVGKTGKGKTSLRTRLREELREECAAIFATVYGRDAVLNAVRDQDKQWKKDPKNKKHADYFKDGKVIQRRLRKTGTHYIIWVVAPRPKEILKIESILINLYRPAYNSKRPKALTKDMIDNPRVEKIDEAIKEQIREMQGSFKI